MFQVLHFLPVSSPERKVKFSLKGLLLIMNRLGKLPNVFFLIVSIKQIRYFIIGFTICKPNMAIMT